MTDEDRVRSLLTLAADLPDEVQAPVTGLLDRGRHRRRVRAAGSVAGAALVVAAAVTVPAALRSQVSNPPVRVGQNSPAAAGPTAAQLARYHWSSLPSSPLGPRSRPLLTWTGRYLIELGGLKKGNTTEDGAVYDSVTRRWHRIAALHVNVGFSNAVEAWTGRQLFVANGQVSSCLAGAPVARCLSHAGLYDPATKHWTFTPLPRQLDGLTLEGAAWTGRDIVVAGVGSHATFRVGIYDPATGRWTMITPKLPPGHVPVSVTMLATPGRVLLWSFWYRGKTDSTASGMPLVGVDVFSRSSSGRWSDITGSWPQGQTVQSPVYGGGRIFYQASIWCQMCSPVTAFFQQRLLNSTTLTPTIIRQGPLRQGGDWLWDGASVVAIGRTHRGKPAMAAYDPPARRWHVLPTPPRDQDATPVWAGRQLFLLTSAGDLLAFHR